MRQAFTPNNGHWCLHKLQQLLVCEVLWCHFGLSAPLAFFFILAFYSRLEARVGWSLLSFQWLIEELSISQITAWNWDMQKKQDAIASLPVSPSYTVYLHSLLTAQCQQSMWCHHLLIHKVTLLCKIKEEFAGMYFSLNSSNFVDLMYKNVLYKRNVFQYMILSKAHCVILDHYWLCEGGCNAPTAFISHLHSQWWCGFKKCRIGSPENRDRQN